MEELREAVAEMFFKYGLTQEVLELNKKLDDLVNAEQLKIFKKSLGVS